jgi:hypothetical protein
MSEKQKSRLAQVLRDFVSCGYSIYFHHGACKGADVEADQIARNLGVKEDFMHIHPSTSDKTRVECWEMGDHLYKKEAPMVRDRQMVDIAAKNNGLLIAAPKNEKVRELRSGTWYTVRYAESKKMQVIILPR